MSFRLLLIEDEAGLSMAISDLLTGEGYEVEAAADGETGYLKALEGSFDLLILDVMLPRRNGFEVCSMLRSSQTTSIVFGAGAVSARTDRDPVLTGGDLELDRSADALDRAPCAGERRMKEPSPTAASLAASACRHVPQPEENA